MLIVEHFVTTAHDILFRNLRRPEDARRIAEDLRGSIYVATGLKRNSITARGRTKKSA